MITVKTFDSESTIDYKQVTTSFTDFGIAEYFGEKAIRDTYEDLKRNFNGNIEYMTELCMVLNWKIFEHYECNNDALVELYTDLWEQCDRYIQENFKGEDLDYFYRTTD